MHSTLVRNSTSAQLFHNADFINFFAPTSSTHSKQTRLFQTKRFKRTGTNMTDDKTKSMWKKGKILIANVEQSTLLTYIPRRAMSDWQGKNYTAP